MKKAFPKWIKWRAPDPEIFSEYASMAREMGFKAAAAAPLVRSSFKADELYQAVGRMMLHPETEIKGRIYAD